MMKAENKTPCEHLHVVRDRFAELAGVHRLVAGNYYCLDCGEPIDAAIAEREGKTK